MLNGGFCLKLKGAIELIMVKLTVSVLMPIYNTKEEFFRSILSQTFTNFGFLILNDSHEKLVSHIIEKVLAEEPLQMKILKPVY